MLVVVRFHNQRVSHARNEFSGIDWLVENIRGTYFECRDFDVLIGRSRQDQNRQML